MDAERRHCSGSECDSSIIELIAPGTKWRSVGWLVVISMSRHIPAFSYMLEQRMTPTGYYTLTISKMILSDVPVYMDMFNHIKHKEI